MDEPNVQESWNKTRIFSALFLLILLSIGGYVLKTQVLDVSSSSKDVKSVKGAASTQNSDDKSKKGNNGKDEKINTLDIEGTIKEKFEDLKKEASSLDITEIASSSPQIQKIINDIKSLEQYPVNQAKEICRQICGL